MTIIMFALAGLCVVLGVFAFILNKEKKKQLEEELKRVQNQKNAVEEILKNYNEAKKENEELYNEMLSGNNSSAATASIDMLHKLSEKGKDRNKQ